MKKPPEYQSKNPVQKRSLMTRQKILDAAMAQIAEIGFEKTNTNLIAKTAGISVGSIYVHFKDKWEIFLTVLDEFLKKVYEYLHQGIDDMLKLNPDLDEMVEWLVRGMYREHQLNGRLNMEIALFVLKDSRAAEIRAFWDRKTDAEIARLFERYKDRLALGNVSAAIIVGHRSAHQVFQYLYQHAGNVDEKAILDEFTAMIKRYVGG